MKVVVLLIASVVLLGAWQTSAIDVERATRSSQRLRELLSNAQGVTLGANAAKFGEFIAIRDKPTNNRVPAAAGVTDVEKNGKLTALTMYWGSSDTPSVFIKQKPKSWKDADGAAKQCGGAVANLKGSAASKVGSYTADEKTKIDGWAKANPPIKGATVPKTKDFSTYTFGGIADAAAGLVITIWAAEKDATNAEILKVGTSSGTACAGIAKDEVGRGVGNLILAKGTTKVSLGCLGFKTAKKGDGSEVNLLRANGFMDHDIETLEWSIRSVHLPANELSEGDRNYRLAFQTIHECVGNTAIDPTAAPQKKFWQKDCKASGTDAAVTIECSRKVYDKCKAKLDALKAAIKTQTGLSDADVDKNWSVTIKQGAK